MSMLKHQLAAGAPRAVLTEERCALFRQHDVARLAAFGFADRHRARVRVEVLNFQADQFAIAAGFQRSADQR
jgi:hypothetical protein